MNLLVNIALFLPLCLGICIVASAMRRDTNREIIRAGIRLFGTMTTAILLICAGIHVVMEWVLAY